MLYDPKWGAKFKPLSTAGLVAWLETKNPETEYDWKSVDGCLIGKYLAAVAPDAVCRYSTTFAGYFDFAAPKPWTFGAALKRARALTER
jgi:hypothetical protein